jgi:hypothetical protein
MIRTEIGMPFLEEGRTNEVRNVYGCPLEQMDEYLKDLSERINRSALSKTVADNRSKELAEEFHTTVLSKETDNDKDRNNGREKKGQGNTGSNDLQNFIDRLKDKAARNNQRLRLA